MVLAMPERKVCIFDSFSRIDLLKRNFGAFLFVDDNWRPTAAMPRSLFLKYTGPGVSLTLDLVYGMCGGMSFGMYLELNYHWNFKRQVPAADAGLLLKVNMLPLSNAEANNWCSCTHRGCLFSYCVDDAILRRAHRA